jgi:putative transposase
MPDFELLPLLFTLMNGKIPALIRFMEHQIAFLKARVPGRLLPDEVEKAAFGRLATEIGRPDLKDSSLIFHLETLFRWHKELVAKKFDGSEKRGPGRPSPWRILHTVVEKIASENPGWGAPRMHGQLQELGFRISEPSVRRLMRKLGLNPDPKPGKRWSDFLERHKAAIVATDFFSYEAWTPAGLQTLYCLFFIQHDTRKVRVAGITERPNEAWMIQMARNLTMEGEDFFEGRKFLIMDRDAKYCSSFRSILKGQGVRCLRLPWKSPNLNAYAERWVRTVKTECLRHLPLLPGPASLMQVLNEYLEHYHHERAHCKRRSNTVTA